MQTTQDGWTKILRGRPRKQSFDNIRKILTILLLWTEEITIEKA